MMLCSKGEVERTVKLELEGGQRGQCERARRDAGEMQTGSK